MYVNFDNIVNKIKPMHGVGNNPMVGATVAVAVAVEEASK